MASDVSICNTALRFCKVGKRISSLEENTKESNVLEEVYPENRDVLLERHDWNFAIKYVALARSSTSPAAVWDYAYSLPSDFIRLVSVHDNSDGRGDLIYKLVNGEIHTDATTVYLTYVYRVTDANQMPPTFRQALAKLIGSEIAVALTNSSTLRDKLYEEFKKDDLPIAKSADALQDRADELPASDWEISRTGGHSGIDLEDLL